MNLVDAFHTIRVKHRTALEGARTHPERYNMAAAIHQRSTDRA